MSELSIPHSRPGGGPPLGRKMKAQTAYPSTLPPRDRHPALRDRFGICQWFHYQDHATLELAVELLHDLGIKHLRTGISWADYLRPGGPKWYDEMMTALADFEVLLSIWHTPPSLSEGSCCTSPPRRLLDYADFIDLLITEYGERFAHLELWNEPNNLYKWNFDQYDPEWRKFGEMVGCAAYWAKQRGKPTVLGGMMPADPHWLGLMDEYGVLPHIDKVAIHGFPGMWWEGGRNWDWVDAWNGWEARIASIHRHAQGRPVWITETGLSTWDIATNRRAKHDLQIERLLDATTAPAERTYWYSLIDLDSGRSAIEGFHVDENEYHLGLVAENGRPKPAYHQLKTLLAEA
jgi:CDP-paratose 2-epimerase